MLSFQKSNKQEEDNDASPRNEIDLFETTPEESFEVNDNSKGEINTSTQRRRRPPSSKKIRAKRCEQERGLEKHGSIEGLENSTSRRQPPRSSSNRRQDRSSSTTRGHPGRQCDDTTSRSHNRRQELSIEISRKSHSQRDVLRRSHSRTSLLQRSHSQVDLRKVEEHEEKKNNTRWRRRNICRNLQRSNSQRDICRNEGDEGKKKSRSTSRNFPRSHSQGDFRKSNSRRGLQGKLLSQKGLLHEEENKEMKNKTSNTTLSRKKRSRKLERQSEIYKTIAPVTLQV